MAPTPTTSPQKSPGHNNDTIPIRATTFIAAALLGRPINIQRRSSNDLEDRAAVSAELRREGAKAKRQTLDLGKPLGPYDTNSVRDRVRKWQAQGGGVITQPDLVYPPEVTPVVSEVGAKTGGGSDEETDIEALRKRYRRERRKERVAAEKRQEEPEDGPVTPKKRVVSDGHWREKPSPPRPAVSGKGKQPDRSPVALPDDGIRVRPMREVIERRRVTTDEKAISKASLDDDGIRVYVTKRQGEDAKKTPRVVVGEEDGIRVYSIKKAGDEGRKASKAAKGGGDEGTRIAKQEDDGKKASKAPVGGDSNRVRGLGEREEDRKEDSRRPLDDDGIRVYSTKRRVPVNTKPKGSMEDIKRSPESKSDSQTEDDRPSPRKTPTTPRNRRKSSGHADVAEDRSPKENKTSPTEGKSRRRRSHRQKSRTPEHSPRPRESPTVEEPPKPKIQSTKINVLKEIYDESKRALRNAKAAEPPPHVPGKRIEAWLSKTPDPFVEPPQNPDTIPPSEIGQPDMMSVIKEEDDESDVHISASQAGRRSRRDSPAIRTRDIPPEDTSTKSPARGTPDIVESASQLVSPSLKRVGAKRESPSPTREKRKSSPVKKLPVQDESPISPATAPQAEPSSPVIDIQSSEFAELPSTLKKRLSTIASVETLNVRSATPPVEPPPPISEASFSAERVSVKAKEEELHESEAGDTFNPEMPEIPSKKSNLKRRLTTHADLISVLSLPRGGNKSIRSARSIRTNRSRLATATIGDLLRELAADETKYMRELRTLVDGVIPVLLHCALSKSDSAVVAELFQRTAEPHKNDPNFTRPIIEMGIALERMKVLHKKIPAQDADKMLRWASGAHEVYSEYLKAWRLGFQDVVVNLAPGNEGLAPDEQSVFKGLPRDENGDVVNGDGERVDVAFLLKRPLVRLKYLAKTFKGINIIKPSPDALEQATIYQNLVIVARRRANEERARLEDEAAASIDATRTRDPRTLGPLTGVSIDRTRRVRARDIFSMDLHHSSGQRIDCKIEMILRDDAPGRGDGGDLLICEVDGTGRWLLFPPVAFGRVSARNGSLKGEIVVMIRGYHSRGKEWQELLVLHNVDEQVGFEWVQLLGLKPVPPEIIRRPSFVVRDQPRQRPSPSLVSSGGTQSYVKSRTPSPRGIDVPIGELARFATKRSDIGEVESPIRECSLSNVERIEEDLGSTMSTAEADEMGRQHGVPVHPPSQDERSASPASSHRATVQARTKYDHSAPIREDSVASPISREPSKSLRDTSISPPSRKASRQPEYASEPQYRPPRDLNEAMMMAGGRPPPSALKRSKAKRRSHYDDESPTKHRPSRPSRHLSSEPQTPPPDARRSSDVTDHANSPSPITRHLSKKADVRTPSPVHEIPIATSKIRVSRGEEITVSFTVQPGRPESLDSEVSYEEESIIQSEEPSTPKRVKSPELEERFLDDLPITKRRAPSALPALDLPTISKTRRMEPITPTRSPSRLSSEDAVLGSPHSEVDRGSSIISGRSGSEMGDIAPPPPPHSPNPIQLKGGKTPVLAHPSSAQQAGVRRRSSSPLKHEYEPSSATSSATSESEESEESAADGQDASSFSESSEEEELEDGDAPTPLLPMAALRALGKAISPHASLYSLPNGTFSPAQTAPQATAQKATKTFKAIANIFSWSEKGSWELLHPDECSIAISPGLIEAFQMKDEHSRSTPPGIAGSTGDSPRQPLVALELTPLVPLRRGTALDISIRSPPMAESKIKVGNNIMFRSRSPEDCETLYAAINTSRINNPKYIALQNAIPHNDGLSPFMDRRAPGRGAGFSWGWSLNRSSYRASSAALPSIASSESSVGSFASAFSALKRFGNGGRLFNISKSTISSRNGSRTGSITTSSSGTSSSFGGNSGGATTPPVLPSDDGDPNKGSPIGLSNTKIRLYSRESASKWRDMGSARLTIMRPPPGPREHNPQNPHHHQQAEEKRIVVTSKSGGAIPLLDVCLSESCFERVARTGIALSVWEEVVSKDGVVGGVPAEGGVGGKSRVYMIQMKTEAETAYTFSLVGKLRY